MKITLTKPTRLWPYFALVLIINGDAMLALMVPKAWPAAALALSLAITLMKAILWPLVFDFGFRMSMDAWRAKCKREEDRSHARFVRSMDEADARWREWNRDHNAGEEWKRGGET